MKQTIKLFMATVLSGGLFFASCSDSKKESTTSISDTTVNSQVPMGDTTANLNNPSSTPGTTTTAAASPEQDFINFAVPANTKEIIWLKAGVDKGSKEVKQHAAMMLKDHQGLEKKIMAYLESHKNITAPSVDTMNTVTINDKTSKEWDIAWANKMVEDHTALLERLKMAETNVKDESLLTIIKPTVKVVESHLSMAKMAQAKMK